MIRDMSSILMIVRDLNSCVFRMMLDTSRILKTQLLRSLPILRIQDRSRIFLMISSSEASSMAVVAASTSGGDHGELGFPELQSFEPGFQVSLCVWLTCHQPAPAQQIALIMRPAHAHLCNAHHVCAEM